MSPRSKPFAIVYHVFYKSMISVFPMIAYRDKVDKEKTKVLMETNFNNNVFIPKVISWEEVVLPGNWQIEDVTPRVNEMTDDLQSIVKLPNGNVEVNFRRKNGKS